MLDEKCYEVLKAIHQKGFVNANEFADIINCPVDDIRNHEGFNYLHHHGFIDFYDSELGLTITGRKALHDYEMEEALFKLQQSNLDVQERLAKCQYLIVCLTAISAFASLLACFR